MCVCWCLFWLGEWCQQAAPVGYNSFPTVRTRLSLCKNMFVLPCSNQLFTLHKCYIYVDIQEVKTEVNTKLGKFEKGSQHGLINMFLTKNKRRKGALNVRCIYMIRLSVICPEQLQIP